MFILLLVFLVFVVFLLIKCVVIVKQAEVMIIERLGKYDRTLESGLNLIFPIIDVPRGIHWKVSKPTLSGTPMDVIEMRSKIDLRETAFDFPRQNVITKDNVSIAINALIYYQITNPKSAVYEIYNLPEAIEKLTQTTLRNIIGELDLDETLISRDTINGKLRTILDEATSKWGVKINRVELQDIIPPRDIQASMEKQMKAERDKRAAILEAEGNKKSAILEAEGIKEANINKAEGERQAAILQADGEAKAKIKVAEAEAEAIRLIVDAIAEKGDPERYLIAMRYIDTLKEMISGKDNKVVYMPYEATGVLSSLDSIKQMFNANK